MTLLVGFVSATLRIFLGNFVNIGIEEPALLHGAFDMFALQDLNTGKNVLTQKNMSNCVLSAYRQPDEGSCLGFIFLLSVL